MTSAAPASGVDPRALANAIRVLAMDAVEAAKSGHPGMPMGMADVATVLFREVLRHDPADPAWPDRDRFVLSAGHGSMLLYALLYLCGYPGLGLDDLRRFRQLGSPTAGHPEYGHAPGIETTTGPLGQGIGNAVGMALAERMLAARYGSELVDHRTWCLAGDGCLMEGISQEAISLAGHLRLSKLTVLWDDNSISIDGPTSLATSEDQMARFAAAGWATLALDGHDPAAIRAGLAAAIASDRPMLLACRTTIGYGAPRKAGTAASHGAPLGAEEIAGARAALGWPHAPFVVPDDILAAWRGAGACTAGHAARLAWRDRLAASPARAEFERTAAGMLLAGLDEAMNAYKLGLATEAPSIATRIASQRAIDALAPLLPELVGGSADLTGSNNTKGAGMAAVTRDNFAGRYIHYGVREHGMAAAMNGIALHGGLIPFGGTFLVFTDYCRPSIRLSALMGLRVIYVMTHDSIGLGEDGPTHQPVEHLAALRAIPGLLVLRPADAVETAECWQIALAAKGPSVLALTRQNLPALRRLHSEDNLSARGGYVALGGPGAAVSLVATGSEVSLAVAARELLAQQGIAANVVSMPSVELFRGQPAGYRDAVLPPGGARVAVEAAVAQGWEAILGERGRFIGMAGFGASGPYQALYRHFGITAEAVAEAAREII